MGDGLAIEQPPDQSDRFVEPVEPFTEAGAEVEAERVVLALEPAPAEAEDEPSARQVVERRRGLGGQARVAERVGGHQEAEPAPGGQDGEGGQGRPALQLRIAGIALVGQQVVVDPDRIPAGGFGRQAGIAQVGQLVRLIQNAAPKRMPRLQGWWVPYRSGVPDQPSLPTAARDAILAWYQQHGRLLPFRATSDPFAVLVSEAMAQQTQAGRAGEAWIRFMEQFPTAQALAAASPADVVRAWRGLGYNRRALNLQRAARQLVERHGGRVPADLPSLLALPGVGPYTARAVAAIAFGQPTGAVDTNVRRVLGRILAGDAGAMPPAALQRAADDAVPIGRAADWTHALMDIGATVCRPLRPACETCPARAWCAFAARPRPHLGGAPPARRRASPAAFPATSRWLRGRIVDRLRSAPDGAWTRIDGPDRGARCSGRLHRAERAGRRRSDRARRAIHRGGPWYRARLATS